MRKVLIADNPHLHAELQLCFPGSQTTCFETLEAALQALSTESFDLVVVGLHFDGLKMFELLAAVRKDKNAPPVVCVKIRPSFLSEEIQISLGAAVRALGGLGFLDLTAAGTEERSRTIDALIRESL